MFLDRVIGGGGRPATAAPGLVGCHGAVSMLTATAPFARAASSTRHGGSAMVARLAPLGTICVEEVTHFQLPTTPFVVRVTPEASSAPKPHAGALHDETWSIVGKGGCVG